MVSVFHLLEIIMCCTYGYTILSVSKLLCLLRVLASFATGQLLSCMLG